MKKKKSMAGKKVAGTLLLAGLMMSAGAMAASGDPVQGGSGSVTINVPIVTSTCSVAVPTEVNFDPVNKNSIPTTYRIILTTKDMNITLSNCSGKTLMLTTHAHAISQYGTDGNFGFGDPDHALCYQIYVPMSPEITGGHYLSGDYWIADLMGPSTPSSLTIEPNSDSYKIASEIYLLSAGKDVSRLSSTVSGSFDYVFTYQ
ncbi:type 1 fimbrial protein [Salmonella enterica]|nr:type 1 fimbrial protein [Salmonella enterica]EIP1339665.1 type 1 fimbrial protein [Salmonella enterica]